MSGEQAYPDAKLVWYDGRIMPREDVRIDPLCHGLHYGTGSFEGIRAYATADGVSVFRLREHLDRWEASSRVLGLPLPYDRATLTRAVEEVLLENHLGDAYVRPLAFLGSSGLGLDTRRHRWHVLVAAWSWGPYLGKEGLEKGIRVGFTSRRKTASSMVPAWAKVSGNYLNGVLALREALDAGHHEAILLNERGHVAEGTGENVFVIKDGTLRTPPLGDDVLPGITRDALLALAAAEGLACREAHLSREDLLGADEAFLTGTAAEVTPVSHVDGQPVNGGVPGPWTRRLQSAFFRAVRGEDGGAHAEWRHVVRKGKAP